MMMDSIVIPGSPSQGAWLLESEQDFSYGANTLSHFYQGSITPSSSTSPNYNDSPLWMEESDNFNWNNLETFSDVLLPQQEIFGPDDLFQEIPDQSKIDPQNKLKKTEKVYESSPITASDSNPQNRPKISIKLKRVKRKIVKPEISASSYEIYSPKDDILSPSSAISSPNNLNMVESNQIPISTVQMYPNRIWDEQPSPILDLNHTMDNILYSSTPMQPIAIDVSPVDIQQDNLDELPVIECSQVFLDSMSSPSSDQSMTLKDIFSMENVDDILDEMLEDKLQTDVFDISSDQSCIIESVTQESDSLSSDGNEFCREIIIPKRKIQKKRSIRKSSTPDTRYSRKKEQNKQAALRYRMKKRVEEENMLETLREAEEKNAELKETYSNLKKELNFMKKLMQEAFIIKGLATAETFKGKKQKKMR